MLTRDERRARQKVEYDNLFRILVRRQRGRCAYCGKVRKLDPHHRMARGLGRRDALKLENGQPQLVAICRLCHQEHQYELSKFTGERR